MNRKIQKHLESIITFPIDYLFIAMANSKVSRHRDKTNSQTDYIESHIKEIQHTYYEALQ